MRTLGAGYLSFILGQIENFPYKTTFIPVDNTLELSLLILSFGSIYKLPGDNTEVKNNQ